MVVRRGKPLNFGDDSSSSDSDDAGFAAAISKKKSGKKRPRSSSSSSSSSSGVANPASNEKNEDDDATKNAALPSTETSSNKRHHHANASRQAKMDALLEELQSTKPTDPATSQVEDYGSIYAHESSYHGDGFDRPPPQKMGSYVEPGQEHLTTNIFVGNLDPTTTEEELTDAFRQFGDLYSVKIMWPRTSEERARNRNTGFVCFMSRKDAEDAVETYCQADVFDNGRRIVLRWGKNVKKTVKFGVGVASNMRKKPRRNNEAGTTTTEKEANNDDSTETKQPTAYSLKDNKAKAIQLGALFKHGTAVYDPIKHSTDSIIVTTPADAQRLKFISTIASFVAKDGSVLEQKLIEAESSNPDFQFLSHGDEDEARMREHIYYRWRVYSFCQGDSENLWRTEPFIMFEPHGRWWIPPPLNAEAVQMEEEAAKRREKDRAAAQEERRRLTQNNEFATGREMERAKFSRGELKLNDWERDKFDVLFRKKLCASQESICDAMSFAFEKSGAAREISELLKESLLEQDGGISADTRVARLFLLSDILFNSQQPGVKNAFKYRDAIEKMSPEIFASLGRHGNGRAGRMTMAKLKKAVSSVLSAWVNWSVFDSSYIDELESKFEGRKISVAKIITEEEVQVNESREIESSDAVQAEEIDIQAKASTIPRGAGFVAIADQDEKNDLNRAAVGQDLDGESLDEDLDGEPLSDGDLDGEPLSDDDLDGEALDDDEILDADVDCSKQ